MYMYMYENSSVSTDKQYLAALYLKSVTAARTRMNFLWHTLEPEITAVSQEDRFGTAAAGAHF